MKIPLLRPRGLVISAGVVILVLIFGWWVLRSGPLAPTRITVTQVQNAGHSQSIYGIGTVEARQTWLLGPTVAGRVLQVHVDVGQAVKAGQLLAEMDPVDLDQRLLAQDAALNRAASVRAAALAQLSDMQARVALAQANWERQQTLAELNFISASAMQGREQERVSAQAMVALAQANLEATEQEVRRLHAERAALGMLRQNSRLIAPADAVVISRNAEPGSTVVAGQPVVQLANPNNLWVNMRVDQGRSNGLTTGLPASIELRSQPRQHQSGHVARVEWLADPVTEERKAYVSFDSVPDQVAIGETAEVTLQLPAAPPGLTVPQASLQTYLGRAGVWRIANDELGFVAVQPGQIGQDGEVQILDGLQANETVVVYNEKPLSPGMRFRVVDALTTSTKP